MKADKRTIPDVLHSIESSVRDIQSKLDPPSEPLPEELVITSTEIATAQRPKIERLIEQLHVPIPLHMLREALQRHLVKFGTLVEKSAPLPIVKKSDLSVKKKSLNYLKPEKGQVIRCLFKGKTVRGVLGRTKSGIWIVKFKDGTRTKLSNVEVLKKVTKKKRQQNDLAIIANSILKKKRRKKK